MNTISEIMKHEKQSKNSYQMHENESDEQKIPEWSDHGPFPRLSSVALYGILGKIVRVILPHTEASAAALFFQLLTIFGILVSDLNKFFRVGGGKHHSNLLTILVGDTASGRKGQSWQDVIAGFEVAMSAELKKALLYDVASGEGLVAALADEVDEDGNPKEEVKRKLVIATEFASVLIASKRKGSNLSSKLRQVYDSTSLGNGTKENPMVATRAIAGLIGHVTQPELHELCNSIDIFSGLINRMLWVSVRSSKTLPSGGNLSDDDLKIISNALRKCVELASKIGLLSRSEDAEIVWERLYNKLAENAKKEAGLIGTILARSQPNLLRISMNLALSDASSAIEVKHLRSAWHAWKYNEASARYIFGSRYENPYTQKLLVAARNAYMNKGHGLTGKEQDTATGGHRTKEARESLLRRGLIRIEQTPASKRGGNSRITIFAVPASTPTFTDDIETIINDPDEALFLVTDEDRLHFRERPKPTVPAELAELADFAEVTDDDREVIE